MGDSPTAFGEEKVDMHMDAPPTSLHCACAGVAWIVNFLILSVVIFYLCIQGPDQHPSRETWDTPAGVVW